LEFLQPAHILELLILSAWSLEHTWKVGRPAYVHRLGFLAPGMGSTVTKKPLSVARSSDQTPRSPKPSTDFFTLESLCFVRRASEEANYLQTCFYCYGVTGFATLTQYTSPS
jgi:hypothetical protein